MGDHGDMGDHSKPTQGGFCDFTAIDNVEEGRGYTVAGIETSEEGILKIEFEDKDAAVGIALEGEPSFDFDCVKLIYVPIAKSLLLFKNEEDCNNLIFMVFKFMISQYLSCPEGLIT